MIAFGPVPSRRLGRSLGINNIPPKVCTYSCVYCQLGKTSKMQVERRPFYEPEEVFKYVEEKIDEAQKSGDSIDYLTFVADGEPTLDANLGQEIQLLKLLGFKVAVITNGSLIWREDVKADLAKADWVSFKIDSTSNEIWRRMNRPQSSLKSAAILTGMLEFAEQYGGELVTETMLVKNINDSAERLKNIAGFLNHLQPVKAYIAVPTRPPAEKWVKPPDENVLNEAFQIFNEKIDPVELLIGYEGNAFASTGNSEADLLSITAVHPMRKEAVNGLLARAGEDWSIVDKLISKDKITEVEYEGKLFYHRKLR